MKNNKQKNNLMGIGIDIESIDRFRKMPLKSKLNFYKKFLADDEIEYCKKFHDPYPHLAARFCAKEAFFKAISNNNNKGKNDFVLDYKKVSIIIKKNKPVILYNKKKYLVSLSHDKDKAVAVVAISS
jgi:phosphopantetheine--protein transferase-like protein